MKNSLLILTIALFTVQLAFSQAAYHPKALNFKKLEGNEGKQLTPHLIFCDPIQLAWSQFTIGYEYVADSMNMGFRFPVTIGLKKQYQEFGAEARFYIGKIYNYERRLGALVMGDGHHRFYVGPNINVIHLTKDWGATARVMGGVTLQILSGLNLNLGGGFGVLKFFTDNDKATEESTAAEFDWTINGTIGWRFSK